jgi:hypothetical protein
MAGDSSRVPEAPAADRARVLLMAKVLVRDDEEVKPSLLSCG